MSEMVERVAKTLFRQESYHGYNAETLASQWIMRAESCRRRARELIEAMREPTEAMKVAGGAFLADRRDHPDVIGAAGAWEDMIDAALK